MKISDTEQIVKLSSNTIFFWTVSVMEKMVLGVLTLIFNVKTSGIKKCIYLYQEVYTQYMGIESNSLPFSNVPFLLLKLY